MTPTSSPLVPKKQRDRLSVDVTPRSAFNMSVRSLPGKERKSLFGAEYTPTRIGYTLSETDVSEESVLLSAKGDIKEGIERDYVMKHLFCVHLSIAL